MSRTAHPRAVLQRPKLNPTTRRFDDYPLLSRATNGGIILLFAKQVFSLLSLRFETNLPQKDSDRQRGPFEGGISNPSEYGDNSIANGIATSSSQFMQPAPVESNPSPQRREGKAVEKILQVTAVV